MIQTTLKIDGMMCSMCEAHINDVIRKNFDVKKVTSNHKNAETIILSKNTIDKDKLSNAIEETGYELKDIVQKEYVKKGLFW